MFGTGAGVVDEESHLELPGCPPGSHGTVTGA